MCKYYLLSCSTNEKEIGCYPQTLGIPSGYTTKMFDKPDSRTKLSNKFFPELPPNLVYDLDNKAILTDNISPTNIRSQGLLINEKIKLFFLNYHLIEHKYYNAFINFNNMVYDYFWLHFVKNDLDGIDIPSSIFKIIDINELTREQVKLQSYKDFLNKKSHSKFKYIRAHQITLNKDFKKKNYDIFVFPLIYRGIFISSKVKMDIEKYNISGFRIKEQSIIQ